MIGDRIKPRPSRFHDQRLTPSQKRLGAVIIRSLRRTCDNDCCGEGTFNGAALSVRNGELSLNGERVHRCVGTQTVGYVVFDAVLKGVRFPARPTGQPSTSQTDDKPDDKPAPLPVPAKPAKPTDKPDDKPAPLPEPAKPAKPTDKFEEFMLEVERLRKFCNSRDEFDDLDSMRVVIDGAKSLRQGLPLDGVLTSITAGWPADTMRQANVRKFDFASYGKAEPMRHAVSPYVAKLVEADVHVYLHGPAGTGKSSAARFAAEQLGLDYYEVNLAGSMASAVKGKDQLKRFIESQFTKAYRDGGVIVLEEFDAAHPTVATAINNALANEHFYNDADGEVYDRHADFRCVATGNTIGTGATKAYKGRMALDGATLDRFRVGRVYVGLDKKLEASIYRDMTREVA